MPPAALQPGLLIIDRTGRARNREDCNASAAGCVLLKHIAALGKTVTARQINQIRPRPSRVNGIAPGPVNDAVAQKPWRRSCGSRRHGGSHGGLPFSRSACPRRGSERDVLGSARVPKGGRTRARMEMTFVDAGDNEALRAEIRPGQIRLVWIEMPSTPIWTVTESAEAARCAHDRGALLAVHPTVLVPVLTRPIHRALTLSALVVAGGVWQPRA
jgi:hypothetical protein